MEQQADLEAKHRRWKELQQKREDKKKKQESNAAWRQYEAEQRAERDAAKADFQSRLENENAEHGEQIRIEHEEDQMWSERERETKALNRANAEFELDYDIGIQELRRERLMRRRNELAQEEADARARIKNEQEVNRYLEILKMIEEEQAENDRMLAEYEARLKSEYARQRRQAELEAAFSSQQQVTTQSPQPTQQTTPKPGPVPILSEEKKEELVEAYTEQKNLPDTPATREKLDNKIKREGHARVMAELGVEAESSPANLTKSLNGDTITTGENARVFSSQNNETIQSTENNARTDNTARTDEFRQLQEESSRLLESNSGRGYGLPVDEAGRERVAGVLQRELESRRSSGGDSQWPAVTVGDSQNPTKQYSLLSGVDGQTFRDFFEIARRYTANGELVDLHNAKTTEDGIGYDDCINYLSEDGLSGFCITPDGDLISVFNAKDVNGKGGFLRAIAPLVKQSAKTLDCYASPNQNLVQMYEKAFGFKTASVMDYNMEYDHDNIAANHSSPQVAFMVNTDKPVETKHFNKDQYAEAVAYRDSYIDGNTTDTVPIKKVVASNDQQTPIDRVLGKYLPTVNKKGKQKQAKEKIKNIYDLQDFAFDVFLAEQEQRGIDMSKYFTEHETQEENERVGKELYNEYEKFLTRNQVNGDEDLVGLTAFAAIR